MIAPVTFEWPRVSASLMAFLSKARAAASRTRRSCHGDFGSHCSGPKSSHCVAEMTVGTSLRPAQGVGDVGLAALQHGEPGQILRDDLPHEALHRGRLAPVAVVRLEDQLDAGARGRERVGARPDGCLLEALVTDQ